MRVLVYAREFPAASTFVAHDVVGLSRQHDVTLLTQRFSALHGLSREKILLLGYDANAPRNRLKRFMTRHGRLPSSRDGSVRARLEGVLRHLDPDVILCHFGDDALLILDNIEPARVPTLVMFHGYDASAWLRNRAYVKRYNELLDGSWLTPIVCTSDMRQRMSGAGLDMTRAEVLHYGCDLSFFRRSPRPENQVPVFLQVGVFREKKGFEYTLRAFAEFARQHPDKPFRLVLAGAGELLRPMQEMARRLGLGERVEFPGWLGPHALRRSLNEADVFVHHSVTTSYGDMEGLPNALIEAAAMELPILSTRHSGIPELVETGVSGILVAERDIGAYSAAIGELMRWRHVAVNRKKVEQQHDLRVRIDSLGNLLRSRCTPRSSRS